MTDNEIKRALECCVGYRVICPNECPLLPCPDCSHKLRESAVDLINRQKAEIERLQTEKNNLIKTYKECALEVVKEFVKRAKEKAYPFPWAIGVEYAVTIRALDEIKTEMAGEK